LSDLKIAVGMEVKITGQRPGRCLA